jgi:hypothetical protein
MSVSFLGYRWRECWAALEHGQQIAANRWAAYPSLAPRLAMKRTAQAPALDASVPIIALTVAALELVGQILGSACAQPTPREHLRAGGKGFDLAGVHGGVKVLDIGPAPAGRGCTYFA